MPDHKKSVMSSSQLKRKLNTTRGSLANAQPINSDEDVKNLLFQWRKRIQIICTDPDATESSSDEEEKVYPKRLVREILVPVHCSRIFSDSEHDLDMPYGAGNKIHLQNQPSLPKSSFEERIQHKRDFQKRSAGEKLPSRKKRRGLSQTRQSEQRQRRQGKWAAETCEPSKDIRLCLGTFDATECSAKAFDLAARKIGGYQTITNIGSVECSNGLIEFDEGFSWEPHQNSFSDSSSVLDIGQDVLPSCCKFDCIMSSPSSVLDNPVSDDGGSLQGHTSGSSIEDSSHGRSSPTDSSSFTEIVDSLEVYRPFEKHGDVNDCTHMVPPSLLDGTLFNSCFGRIFDIDIPVTVAEGLHVLDSFASGEELHDMDFDLDSEALAWINVSEASRT